MGIILTFYHGQTRNYRCSFHPNLKGPQTLPDVTKLNHKKIRWIVRHCAESNDFSTGEAAKITEKWRDSGVNMIDTDGGSRISMNLSYGTITESMALSGLKWVKHQRMLIGAYCTDACLTTQYVRLCSLEKLPKSPFWGSFSRF